MRKKILAANWKMNLTHSEAESYLQSFLTEIGDVNDVEVVIIPPLTAIPALVSASEKIQALRIGAQNMHWEKSGAYTGEISATMLRALYVKYVVLGHSERRSLFGETDEIVNRKVRAALDAGLRPIFVSVKRFTNGIASRWSRFWRGRCAAVWKEYLRKITPKSLWLMSHAGPLERGEPPRRPRPNRRTPLFVPFCPGSPMELRLTGFGSNTAGALSRIMPRS